MNGAAITRRCTGCKKHFIGVAPGLCPACEKDSAVYKASRKKGDPREFLPYPELLDQWRRRRAECRDWKKAAGFSATERAAWAQAEQEKTYLLAVLTAMNADLDPALELGAELDKVRAELGRITAHADHLAQRVAELQAGKPEPWEAALKSLHDLKTGGAVPPEQWRRLVQLAHPDKHDGSPAAVEATRWLLENRT
jgi:hypothetical protein